MKNNNERGHKRPLAGLFLLASGALILSACSSGGTSYSIELNTGSTIAGGGEGDTSSQPGEDVTDSSSSSDDLPTDPTLRKYVLGLREGSDLSEVLTIQEIMDVVQYLWGQNEENSWYCKGDATALGTIPQWISSCGFKKDGNYLSESLSYGLFAQPAARAYQSRDQVTLYHTSGVSIDSNNYPVSADFQEEHETLLTAGEYAADWGWDLTHFGNYFFGTYSIDGVAKETIITDQSLCYEGTDVSSAKRNEDGTYTVFINLDPIGGVLNYAKQMETLSNLDETPSFYYSLITYTLDKELNPISASIEEFYQAKMFLSADTTASMTIVYFPGVSPEFPDVTEPVDYTASGLY